MKSVIKNISAYQGESVISDAAIYIDEGIIEYIGPAENLPELGEDVEVIDGRGGLAVPGLYNAHSHHAMTMIRGIGADQNLQTRLEQYVWPAEARMTDEHIYWGSLLAIAESIRFGVVCFNDMYDHMDQVAKAVLESGVRAVLARGVVGDLETAQAGIDENIALYNEFHGAEGRIKVFFAPHAEYTTTPDVLRTIADKAKELQTGIHMHISETRTEVEGCLDRYGVTPIEYSSDLGIFDVPCIAAHCVSVDEEDIRILSEKRVTVSHNPVANLKLGSGIAPIPRMMEAGINIALGTDSAAANDNLNLWEELKLAAILHKGANRNASLIKAHEAFEMASRAGAVAMGFDGGDLKRGKAADIVLLAMGSPQFQPRTDLPLRAVYAAQGSDVVMTMVDGKVLYRSGEFLTIDYPRVMREVKKLQKTFL